MSSGLGARTASASLLSKLAPECNSMGRSLKTVSMVLLIMVFVAFVLLIVAIIYTYMKKTDTNNDQVVVSDAEKHKRKITATLSVIATVILAISTFVSIWQFNISAKTAKLCLSPS